MFDFSFIRDILSKKSFVSTFNLLRFVDTKGDVDFLYLKDIFPKRDQYDLNNFRGQMSMEKGFINFF